MPKPVKGKRALAIEKVLTAAARTGNVEAAISSHGRTLSIADANVIRGLSASELKAVSALKAKLGPLGRAADDNNGVVF
jgi:hypothetical protein